MAGDGEKRRWLPLEANPEVMNKFAYELGVGKEWAYTDVYGLDEDLLAMVPQPVAALLLLFPINEQYEQFRLAEQARIEQAGQTRSSNVVFVKQTIGNACGTIGLIHSVCNNAHRIPLGDGFFARFAEDAKTKTPDELAQLLEGNRVLSEVHEQAAQAGQSEAPSVDEDINLHFICFVEKDGHLYELDGRKPFPINHGPSSPDSLLTDAIGVVKQFMERDPTNLQFTLIALAPTLTDD